MTGAIRAILIGGSSHAGKSTLSREIAARLGGGALSTDRLARHPGRPWGPQGAPPPPHVAEHYGTLAPEQLLAEVLAHYDRMWPMVKELVEAHVRDPTAPPLVLEGSALWPERLVELDLPGVRALWLTAPAQLFEARMRAESGYAERDPEARRLIDSFLARTLLYDERMMEIVLRRGLAHLEVGLKETTEALAARSLAALGVEAG